MGRMDRGARPLPDQRAKFEVDDDVAYFNTASLSPVLRVARAAGEAALVRRARPWTVAAADWFTDVEELRSRFARLVGGTADDVAIVPATSYGLAVAARNLTARPGDRVLVLDHEFPSSYLTWRRFTERTGTELLVVERQRGQSWTDAILEAVDERVAIASVPNVHWTNGAPVELPRVESALREAGSAFVIDATQSLGALPLDVGAFRPDALMAGGYKWLLGPLSVSYLLSRPCAPRRGAARGELDIAGRLRGLRGARRLRGRISTGRPAVRRRPALELPAGGHGAGGDPAASGLDRAAGSR